MSGAARPRHHRLLRAWAIFQLVDCHAMPLARRHLERLRPNQHYGAIARAAHARSPPVPHP